jgi:hypothetical protein
MVVIRIQRESKAIGCRLAAGLNRPLGIEHQPVHVEDDGLNHAFRYRTESSVARMIALFDAAGSVEFSAVTGVSTLEASGAVAQNTVSESNDALAARPAETRPLSTGPL